MRAVSFVAVIAVAGCSDVTTRDPRTAWLEATLIDDNRLWLERDPSMVAGKLQEMATRRYDFFRGTDAQFWRDVAGGDAPVDVTTAFGDGPSSLVWLQGDPHLENFGSFRAGDGTLLVDLNDFDAASFGPWWDDLRRLAVGLRLACADATTLTDADADRVVRAAVAGYADEIASLASGGAPFTIHDGAGTITDVLIAKAQKHGDDGKLLADYTRVVDGQRTMFYGDVSPPRADGVYDDTAVAVDGRERALLDDVIAQWRFTTEPPRDAGFARVLGASRRLGAGVSSYPLDRFYVLIAGASDALDDDVLLEVKEETAGLRLPLPRFPDVGFASEGARVVASQHVLGERRDDDALIGYADTAPRSWKVRERSSWQVGVDETDLTTAIDAGDNTLDDLVAFAGQLGHVLARAHGRAPTATGARGVDVIAPRIAGRADALADEVAGFAAAYTPQVDADYHALQGLLVEDGPLLGFVPR